MVLLSKKEREELLRLSKSSSLRKDMKYLRYNRYNPVIVNEKIEINRLITFLTQLNELVNHKPKPFKEMIDRVMKL